MELVDRIRFSTRTVDYGEIASVKTIGVGGSRSRHWWAPGLQLRVSLRSGEDIFIRATSGPFVTRRARSLLLELERALQSRLLRD
jgi:hypothetical protein